MYNDIIDLRSFYDSSLGTVARRLIRDRLRALWPDTRGQRILGLGYATPYLRPFRDDAERVIALMPAPQGVTRWPRYGRSLVGLTYEQALPLADMSIDRVIIVHGAEVSDTLPAMMQEVWRVLCGTGRVVIVVPSRSGVWARSDRTPFGHGRTFSAGQLRRLLRDHLFLPEVEDRALFLPPTGARMVHRWAPTIERVGHRWTRAVGGVLVVEASKQLYHISPNARRIAVRRPSLLPLPQPVPQARFG